MLDKIMKNLIKMNREKYLRDFKKNDFPIFQCPKCKSGILEVIEGTFIRFFTKESEEFSAFVGEMEILESIFISFLRCNNKKCNEINLISGKGRTEEVLVPFQYPESLYNSPQIDTYGEEYYTIKYFSPPVHIIKLPNNVPEKIRLSLVESFFLFWIECSSTSNKIRQTIEILMDFFQINEENLHRRIEKFGEIENEKYKNLSKMLITLKCLGNFGSHRGGLIKLKKEDLLDAYDVLDFVLCEIFVKDNYYEQIKLKTKNLKKKYEKER